MISCLFQLNFVFFLLTYIFSSLIPIFSYFTLSKRTQNSFMTIRPVLDALLILIFIFIYSSLFSLFPHLTCPHIFFILLHELGNIETTTKFSRLKSISRIEDYSFTLVIYLFSSVSLQLQRKTIILYCEENVY